MKKILEKREEFVREPISKSQSLHLLIYKTVLLNQEEEFNSKY